MKKQITNRYAKFSRALYTKVGLTLLLLLLAVCNITAAKQPVTTGKIQDFAVYDAPNDDGAGLKLSWRPLPKEMRIIQYRIYRGINPDTLYYFSQMEVDPKLGFTSDRMNYYDKDFQLMLTIDSPAKLKKEKQQSASSPLYKAIPRDPKVLASILPYFTVLGIVDQANVYKHSVKITNADGSVSAGVNTTQFEQVAANPIMGKKYYYTVLAVNEKGEYLPYADIKSAVPEDNPPDASAKLTGSYVTDTQEFKFEWTTSIVSYDIANWQFWLMPKSQLSKWEGWQTEDLNQYGQKALSDMQAILLGEKPNDYNYFYTLKLNDSRVVNPDGSPGAMIPVGNLQDYQLILATQDYNGYTSYALANPLRLLTAKQLPLPVKFDVRDKPDDKGDTSALAFGLPICFITQAAYTSPEHTKIRINYELSENMNYKIDRIYFDVYTAEGRLLGKIKENYPDKIINLKLSKLNSELQKLHVKMAFVFKKSKEKTDYYVMQDLLFDTQTRRFMNADIYYKGENLSKLYYQIFRKNQLESGYSPVKKLSTISRSFDDIINFESTLQKMVSGVDVKTGRLLLDPHLTFAVDAKTGMPLSINIYRAEQEKAEKELRTELIGLKAQLAKNPALADSLNQLIAEKDAYLKALTSHPAYIAAAKTKNDRDWLQVFHREQQLNARTYSYLIMKTDNEGGYSFSTESMAYIPIANWFNWNFLIALIASILFMIIVIYSSYKARHGSDLYLRPIAGLSELDNAVGRATEMGKPILYIPGWGSLGEITTIASMMILNRVAKKAAEYDTRILVPNSDYYVMPLAQEMVREACYEAGRPDSYDQNDVFYIVGDQFPFAAGVNGVMIREKCATVFYMGYFNAEALLMTETGNSIGAIQIAGTDAVTQVPFFITTCDYTMIGEEYYAASAYLSKDVELVSLLKAQDYFKFLIVFFILAGAILSTLNWNWLTNTFPTE